MLARGTIAFAREALGLLRESLQRGFELACDLAQPLGDRRLRKQFAACCFDLDFRGGRRRESFGVRLFRRPQQQRAAIRLFAQSRVFRLQAKTLGLDQNKARGERFDLRAHFAFPFLNLRELILLVDTLACLAIALQHGFGGGCANG